MRKTLGGDKNALCLDYGGGYVTVYFVRVHQTHEHLRRMNFIDYELYFNKPNLKN